MSRWKVMDEDISDDQQDIARGRGMVDSKFQGGFGLGGTAVRYLRTTLTREPDCECVAHPSVVRSETPGRNTPERSRVTSRGAIGGIDRV